MLQYRLKMALNANWRAFFGEVSPMSTQFYSPMSLAAMATSAGAKNLRDSLAAELRAKGADPDSAFNGLATDDAGDLEAVARLVSLARARGLCVELKRVDGNALRLSVVKPSTVGLLQSGHSTEPKPGGPKPG